MSYKQEVYRAGGRASKYVTPEELEASQDLQNQEIAKTYETQANHQTDLTNLKAQIEQEIQDVKTQLEQEIQDAIPKAYKNGTRFQLTQYFYTCQLNDGSGMVFRFNFTHSEDLSSYTTYQALQAKLASDGQTRFDCNGVDKNNHQIQAVDFNNQTNINLFTNYDDTTRYDYWNPTSSGRTWTITLDVAPNQV